MFGLQVIGNKKQRREKHTIDKQRDNGTGGEKEETKAKEPQGSEGSQGKRKQGEREEEGGAEEKLKPDSTSDHLVTSASRTKVIGKGPANRAEQTLAGRTRPPGVMALEAEQRKTSNLAHPVRSEGGWGKTSKQKRLASRQVEGPERIGDEVAYCLPGFVAKVGLTVPSAVIKICSHG